MSNCLRYFGTRVSIALERAKKPPPNLSRDELSALKTLKNDPTIVISRKADKGNALVILNSEDYELKMMSILDEPRFFKKIPSNPTLKREKQLNAFLLSLQKREILEKKLYMFLRTSNSRTPQAYGLPKIHKDGTPLRPIISAVRSFNYNVGKFLVWILSPYMDKCDSYIRNSAHLVEELSLMQPDQSFLASFDVSSLFTNVPVAEAVNLSMDLITQDDDTRNFIPSPELRRLFEFSTSYCNFQFAGQNFDQVDGLAMGNPLAPPLAHLFMVKIEKSALNRGIQGDHHFHFLPLWWRRYVDDIIVKLLLTDRVRIPDILTFLNSLHPNIRFTVEIEEDGTLSFLEDAVY
ncbi:MAG: hypothetical protein GY696_00765 [Gammaproteobacteria bacterium]|nr:hypothetical protein [Gammaproteobacteria bacterium]